MDIIYNPKQIKTVYNIIIITIERIITLENRGGIFF